MQRTLRHFAGELGDMKESSDASVVHYEITVEGCLDQAHWPRWFGGLTVTPKEDGTTVLLGPVTDQAALYGLLGKARDLGLTLISVQRR